MIFVAIIFREVIKLIELDDSKNMPEVYNEPNQTVAPIPPVKLKNIVKKITDIEEKLVFLEEEPPKKISDC